MFVSKKEREGKKSPNLHNLKNKSLNKKEEGETKRKKKGKE